MTAHALGTGARGTPTAVTSVQRPGVAARAGIALVHLYQSATTGRASGCRFYPSCSDYAAEALETHGGLKGSLLTLRRLSRCRPFGGRGCDPVPE